MKITKLLSCFWLCSVLTITASHASERADTAWRNVQQQDALLIDVRSEGEFSQGHIDKAYNIPHTVIADQIAAITKDKNQAIVVYCRSGNRSGYALQVLQAMGYQHVVNGGGLNEMMASQPK
ncbi:rhodanese-like domain-containing protein [Agarivorans sp. MS3-6]|uniref:rhodanese-like domain-containing protein n=1 Tax=Agarivorans sp. TSD2052 TaxID=2937286 RepID=UPI00200EC6EC|nr:rhodanese-like domain-containing protein [Agarivorans sp. TSD2052]UPW18106.1 rhodanese-like domain-containing protein [Agarivorans sp. TSD2052]